jgi:hypothetical protein
VRAARSVQVRLGGCGAQPVDDLTLQVDGSRSVRAILGFPGFPDFSRRLSADEARCDAQ